MKLTSHHKHGFTLIELMVTIGIVAIMTIIAVPALTRYIVQGKVSDAIVATANLQSIVVRNVANNESVTNSGIGISLPSNLGRYVQTFNVSDDGIISLTTTSTANSVSLTLTPSYSTTTQQVSWVCAVTDADMNDYVPSRCRI